MDPDTFKRELSELVREVSALPTDERAKLEALVEQTKQRQAKVTSAIDGLQESIDYLRLSIKYLMFDLEATRRENAYLRKMLEEEKEP